MLTPSELRFIATTYVLTALRGALWWNVTVSSRAHGRFLELIAVHLAEAADLDLLALEFGRFELGAAAIVAGVEGEA